MRNRVALFGLAIGLALVASVCADENRPADLSDGWGTDNVRQVQTKLRDSGLYFGEVDGAYSSELAAAVGRYQIRNGLPITGLLDPETAKALGAKPAVATSAGTREQSSETWRRLRTGDQERRSNARDTLLPRTDETPGMNTATTTREAAAATGPMSSESPKPASAPPATVASSPAPEISEARLRDYVGAFVLAGLDPQVGAEAAFFADRVQYYNDGTLDREKIRADLKRYDARWPERRFWLAGDIKVEPQSQNRVRVTFPLKYELRKGAKHSSGKVDKTLVLEPAGDDLQIVAVNERKAE
jgi:peptidoglycan hydrolase-like protein with peptidoglycan-binding domain